MTTIAALRENEGSILIAADSGGLESPALRIRIPGKLKRHAVEPIAWAVAGNDSIGEQFTNWLMQEAEFDGWPKLRDRATEALARLIGRQRQLMAHAGREARQDDLAAALLVGWLEDQPQIIELSEDNKHTSYLAEGFHAIGTGKLYAYTTNQALKRYKMIAVTRLRRITGLAATMAIKSELPINIWRVTPGGVQEL